jgi:hypothetical protein
LTTNKHETKNTFLLAIHYVSQKAQQQGTYWTGALRAQGRVLDQEKSGKEQQKWNCRRFENAGERQKD